MSFGFFAAAAKRATNKIFANSLVENFIGTDGSALPSAWTVTNTGTSSATIQNNMARFITPNATFTTGPLAYWSGMNNILDQEVSCQLYTPNLSVVQYPILTVRSDGVINSGGQQPRNGYYMTFLPSFGFVQVGRMVNGTKTQFIQYNQTYSSSQPLNIRFRVIGNIIQAKSWLTAEGESSNWNGYDGIDNTPYLIAGKVSIQGRSGDNVTNTVMWDTVSLFTDSEPLPTAPASSKYDTAKFNTAVYA